MFAKARGWLGLAIFVGLLALSPVSPLATRFAYIAIGALYAMSPRVKREIDAIGARSWAPLLAIGLFAIAVMPPGVVFLDNVLNAAGPVLLAVLFFGALAKQGPLCRLVDMVWLQRLGLISYSVYIWQQLSLGPTSMYGRHWMLSLPFFFLAPALISYFAIERPFIAIGRRLSKRMGAAAPSRPTGGGGTVRAPRPGGRRRRVRGRHRLSLLGPGQLRHRRHPERRRWRRRRQRLGARWRRVVAVRGRDTSQPGLAEGGGAECMTSCRACG